MTAREFINWAAQLPAWASILFFVIPPALSFVLGKLHGRGNGNTSPWKYIYSLIIYWVCIPGIFSALITLYTLFFTGENLLDQNILIYVLPLISMILTLIIISGNTCFDDIPGFDRIYGLMAIIAIVFIFLLAVHKTRLWMVFGSSIFMLAILIILLVALLEKGFQMLFKKHSRE